MTITRRVLLVGGCALVAGCGGDGTSGPPDPPVLPSPPPLPPPLPPPAPPPPPPSVVSVTFSFATGLDGFSADVADFTPGMEPAIAFVSEFRRLPPPLDNRFGYFLGGTNASDDLFMYIFRAVSGLAPNTAYRLTLSLTFATNVPAGCAGIGGAPGEAVLIKAGGVSLLPQTLVVNNRLTTNFDHGDQTTGSSATPVLGDFTGGGGGCGAGAGIYQSKTVAHTSANAPVVTSDAAGRIWIVAGTDSGFEGRTEIFYLEGSAVFVPVQTG